MLRWARENGCPWGTKTGFQAAEELGHTDDLGNLVDEYGAEYIDENSYSVSIRTVNREESSREELALPLPSPQRRGRAGPSASPQLPRGPAMRPAPWGGRRGGALRGARGPRGAAAAAGQADATDRDRAFMRRAVELARRAEGQTCVPGRGRERERNPWASVRPAPPSPAELLS